MSKRAIKLISGKASAVVPHDWESERAVLGGILLTPGLYRDVQSEVGFTRDDLHNPIHQALWDLLARLPTPDLSLRCPLPHRRPTLRSGSGDWPT